MSGITFVGPRREAAESTFDDLQIAFAAPLLYTGDNRLSQHLWRAMWHPEAELSAPSHSNQNAPHLSINCDANPILSFW